ncbi:MAG: hypothetical protein MEQ84_10225 [Mesorhizobium sp.]|nr:hypothetical protein [Mesorhizobium sp.]
MDGSAAIEENRQALKRIVATLVDMAGLAEDAPERDKLAEVRDSPLTASLRSAPLPLRGGEEEGATSPPRSPLPRRSGERWPAKRVGEGVDVTRDGFDNEGKAERIGRTIPRLLWRAILALLRPAESAARRLIIATARGLVGAPPAPRQPKQPTMEPLLRRFGIAVMVTPADRAAILPRSTGEGDHAKRGGGGAEPCARLSLPLFDPPRRLALYGQRRRHVPPHAAPRIWCPGLTEPARLPPPPSPEDLVSAEHLGRRIAALTAALDDLPGQARRFARLRASREAQLVRHPTTSRRMSPLRRGRPPGGRLARYDPAATHPRNIREIDEILAHAHALALYALENPDTS